MSKQQSEASDLINFKNSQGLKAKGTLLKLSQNYIVFEVYNPYSIVQLSETLVELIITRTGKEIYNGKAVVTNIVNTGIILIVSATLSDAYWKSTIDIHSRDEIWDEIKYLINNFEEEQKIDPEFRINVLSIQSFLLDVRNWCEKIEPLFDSSGVEIDSNFLLNYFAPLFEKFGALHYEFYKLVLKIGAEKVNLHRTFVQGLLHPFLMSSPFPYRIYSKPLGYAGDYEMMRMIQRENAEGKNIFAKFVNVFYTNIPIAICVKNRTAQLVAMIEDGVKKAEAENREFRLLSIGCGPALEIKQFLETNSPKIKCHFRLLDFNEETLNFAVNQANKAKGSKNCEIESELNSVHELLKRSTKKKDEEEKYDFVYCSGLFDYLSDRICAKLIKLFFSMVRKGGKVFVTNMHSDNNSGDMMKVFFEWYLIYRDETNMSSLVPGLGKQRIYTDSTGVNLCLEITKQELVHAQTQLVQSDRINIVNSLLREINDPIDRTISALWSIKKNNTIVQNSGLKNIVNDVEKKMIIIKNIVSKNS